MVLIHGAVSSQKCMASHKGVSPGSLVRIEYGSPESKAIRFSGGNAVLADASAAVSTSAEPLVGQARPAILLAGATREEMSTVADRAGMSQAFHDLFIERASQAE